MYVLINYLILFIHAFFHRSMLMCSYGGMYNHTSIRSSGTQISSDTVSECGVPEVSPEQPGPVHTPGGDLGLQAGDRGHVLLHEADPGQPLTEHRV